MHKNYQSNKVDEHSSEFKLKSKNFNGRHLTEGTPIDLDEPRKKDWHIVNLNSLTDVQIQLPNKECASLCKKFRYLEVKAKVEITPKDSPEVCLP